MNTAIFVGNITRDAIARTTKTGKSVGTFSIACNRPYIDKSTGETKQITDYINVVLWGNYDFSRLAKGTGVIVIGRQTTRKYEQNGQEKYITEIVASDVGLHMRPMKEATAEEIPERWAGFVKPAQEDIPF